MMVDPPRFDRRLSDLDALLWSLEAHPLLRSNILAVASLARSPGIVALNEHMERASRLLPRLRHRVVGGPLGIAPPRWELDPAFDLGYHVRRVGAAGAGVDHGSGHWAPLLELAEPMATECFDPARPLWKMVLVEGLDGDRAGLVVKVHHAFTDGVGAVRLAMALFDLSAERTREAMPPKPDEASSTGIERAWDDADYEVRRGLALARRALPWMARGLRDSLAAPEDRARQAVELVRSARRLAGPARHPLSPVMTGRSLRTRLGVVDFPLDEMRASARAAGGTLNDAFLAGVTGGLRRYHDKHGSRPDHLRLGMAVNRRRAGTEDAAGTDDVVGNMFAPLRLSVALQVTDPFARVAGLSSLVHEVRSEPVLDLFEAAAAVAGHTPAAVSAALAAAMLATDVVASNVPGAPVPLWLAGVEVQRLVAFGPRSGSGLNLTLLSHDGRVEVGINMDPQATPDTDTLMACLRSGFDEILELR